MKDWPPSIKASRYAPDKPSVGIVMPVRDDLAIFKLCFYSLVSFADFPNVITLVDNMSSIKTVYYLRNLQTNHNANILQYQKEHNLAAEWNIGMQSMFKKSLNILYGVALTPTFIMQPFWLSRLVTALDNTDEPIAMKTNAGIAHAIAFHREFYESFGGFDESTDPVISIAKKQRLLTVPEIYAHKFIENGFDPRVEERDLMEEDYHARA